MVAGAGCEVGGGDGVNLARRGGGEKVQALGQLSFDEQASKVRYQVKLNCCACRHDDKGSSSDRDSVVEIVGWEREGWWQKTELTPSGSFLTLNPTPRS